MKKKQVCPRCNKTKNSSCFIYNKVVEKELCRMCHKSVGTNKFYSPENLTRKTNYISKYNLADDEKKALASKNGWKNVKATERYLKAAKEKAQIRKKQNEIQEKQNAEKQIESQKKFLEGLGQK